MDLLVDVMDLFNKFGGLSILSLSMVIFILCGCKEQSYINWGQWLECEAHLKLDVFSRAMNGYIIAIFNIRH